MLPQEGHGMKKVLASALVIMAVLLCAVSQAWAETDFKRQHGDWVSFIYRDSEGSFPIMRTFDRGEQSVLGIAVYPNGNWAITVCVARNMLKSTSIEALFGKTVSGYILVGNGRVHDVNFKYGKNYDGGLLWIDLDKKFCDVLIQEAYRMQYGEISIEIAGLPKILKFSLNGFKDAMDRCQSLLGVCN